MELWMHGSWMWLWVAAAAALLVLVVWLVARSPAGAAGSGRSGYREVSDPVCGMTFPPEEAVDRMEYRGTVYYFCAHACRREFEREPDRYVTGS